MLHFFIFPAEERKKKGGYVCVWIPRNIYRSASKSVYSCSERDTKKLQEASCATLSPSDKRRDPLAYNDKLQPRSI